MNLRGLVKSLSEERWNIGFIENSLNGVLCGEELRVNWVKHNYKDCWFADPFILEITDDEIHVLVEEFYKPIKRGRIARLVINRHNYELKRKDVVLELTTHLSFPAIRRIGEDVYIYPENGESGELNIYQYFPENNRCVKVERMMNESVADAVITEIDGKEYLFCTKQPNPNGNVLSVYEREHPKGSFMFSDDYSFEENVARMAGDFFEYHGKLYRPTQECNIQYGHAVTLQEVERKDGKFIFKEVRRMFSVHPQLTVGMHTFNMYKGLIVTDALGFKNMWLRRFLKEIGVMKR